MFRLLTLTLLAVSLGACGDGPAGPGDGFALAGTWSVTITDAATFARTCTVPPITITITGDNATATGMMAVGGNSEMICILNDGSTEVNALPLVSPLSTARVTTSGAVFSIQGSTGVGNGGWTYNGARLGNDQIAGDVAFREPVGGVYSTITGAFTATRQ